MGGSGNWSCASRERGRERIKDSNWREESKHVIKCALVWFIYIIIIPKYYMWSILLYKAKMKYNLKICGKKSDHKNKGKQQKAKY